MRRAEIVTAVLMAVFSIYLMWKSAELPVGRIPDEGPGGGAFSFWLSAVMLVCCVWIAINRVRRNSPPSRSDAPFMDTFARNKFVLVGGGVTAMIGLVHIVGMYGADPTFLIYNLRILGRHSRSLSGTPYPAVDSCAGAGPSVLKFRLSPRLVCEARSMSWD